MKFCHVLGEAKGDLKISQNGHNAFVSWRKAKSKMLYKTSVLFITDLYPWRNTKIYFGREQDPRN